MFFFGYTDNKQGHHSAAVRLTDQEAVIRYIQENLDSRQLIITDAGDHQLLLMCDGVDLFNDLGRIGISLQAVLNQIREEMVEAGSNKGEKPEWERLYDQIGLSSGEIRMRQRVKAACRAAQTVADVAEIVRGTYFDAHFLTPDGNKWYRFFNEDDYSITLMTKDDSGTWIDEPERVFLSPTTLVRHLHSSEDIHTFEMLN
jgi:hypothetical protein